MTIVSIKTKSGSHKIWKRKIQERRKEKKRRERETQGKKSRHDAIGISYLPHFYHKARTCLVVWALAEIRMAANMGNKGDLVNLKLSDTICKGLE